MYTHYNTVNTTHIFLVNHPKQVDDSSRWRYELNNGAFAVIKKILDQTPMKPINLVSDLTAFFIKNLDKYVYDFDSKYHTIDIEEYDNKIFFMVKRKLRSIKQKEQ